MQLLDHHRDVLHSNRSPCRARTCAEHIAEDPKDWFINWAHFRANETAKEISQKYTNHKIDNGEAIVAVGVTAMVQAAYDEKIVMTSKEANEIGMGKTM